MKLPALLRLLRLPNCAMMGLAVIVGAFIAKGFNITSYWIESIMGFITGFSLTGSAMAVNDVYDREIDAVNEPHRPIPRGEISTRRALSYAFTLGAIGLLAAFLTNLSCLIVALCCSALMLLYSAWGKRTGLLGNLMVSSNVAIPFVYGGLVVQGTVDLFLVMFSAMAFLSNTGREITKGISDVEGDRKSNIRTLAVSMGAKASSFVASAFYMMAVVASVFPLAFNLVSFWYTPLIAIADAGFVISSISLLRDHSGENSRKSKKRVLFWMLIGLIGFLTGKIY